MSLQVIETSMIPLSAEDSVKLLLKENVTSVSPSTKDGRMIVDSTGGLISLRYWFHVVTLSDLCQDGQAHEKSLVPLSAEQARDLLIKDSSTVKVSPDCNDKGEIQVDTSGGLVAKRYWFWIKRKVPSPVKTIN
jgi:hypothetical protein